MKDRPRALAVLIAVFLVGIIIGVAGLYLWLKPSADSSMRFDDRRPFPPNGPVFNGPVPNGPAPSGLTSPKRPDFNLTPEQKKLFGEIFEETKEGLEALRKEQKADWEKLDSQWGKKFKDFWDENSRRVRSILDEEQKAPFDDWMNKRSDWWDRTPRHMGPEPPKENRKKPERR